MQIAGWLYNLRKSGKIVFPIVRDGTGLMQCVAVKSALPEALFETIKDLTQESSHHRDRQDPRRAARRRRLRDGRGRSAKSCSACPESDPYPITPKEHGVDFLMDHRHLWLRSQRQHAIIRVRHEVIKAVRDYFDSHGFTLVDTPIFTPAACEGTTTLFEVNYFDDEQGVPDAVRPALQRSHGHGVRQGLLLRADVSRREIEDAPPSDGVLDGGAGDGLRRLSKTSSASPRSMLVFVVGRVLENRREELKVLERDVSEAGSDPGAVPAHELRRRGEDSAGQGQRDPVGRRFRRHRRDAAQRRSSTGP